MKQARSSIYHLGKGRLSLLLLLLCLFYLPGQAQEFRAFAQPNRIGLDDALRLNWKVSGGDATDFRPPAVLEQHFTVYSRLENSEFYNGVGSTVYTYTARPKHAGTITIPGATIRVNGHMVISNPLTVTVVNSEPSRSPDPGISAKAKGPEYFLKCFTDKTAAYVGERITVTYKLYLRQVRLEQHAPPKMPELRGFWSQELRDQADNDLQEETINGKTYYTAVLRKAYIYPQKAGALVCDPMQFEATFLVQQKSQPGWPFDSDILVPEHKVLASNPVTINVKPLPEEGKPANFSGMVGELFLRAQMEKGANRAYESFQYTVFLEGEGNFAQAPTPSLKLPASFESYDPQATATSDDKRFEFTLLPKEPGRYTLTTEPFVYFNSKTKRYETLQAKPIQIDVEQARPGAVSQYKNSDPRDRNLLRQDIRDIREQPGLWQQGRGFFGATAFWVLTGFPLAALAGLVLWKQRRQAGPHPAARKKVQDPLAEWLAGPKAALAVNDRNAFHAEMLKSLYGYLFARTGLSLAESSRERLRGVLESRNISEEAIQSLHSLIDTSEFARYAPSAASGDLQELYTQAHTLLRTLEAQLNAPAA